MESDCEDRCHPATLVAHRLADVDFDQLQGAVRRGLASPYILCDDDVHIPPSKIRGRIEHPQNGVFTACLDTQTGKIRVDHTGNHAFWLEINVRELADVWLNAKYHPDNAVAQALAAKHGLSNKVNHKNNHA